MLKSNVGWSIAKDSKTAGKEAAQKAMENLTQTKVALLYTSADNNVEEVLEGAKEALGSIPVVGCTSSGGIIVPDGYITSENGFVGVMALSDSAMSVGVAGSALDKDARETGRKIAQAAMKNAGKTCAPAYFYMSASPKEEEDYLKGIEDIIGRVPMFGGSAADNTVEGKWSLYADDVMFSDGCVVAFFYTDKPMSNVYTGAYRETNDVGIITKVEGKRKLMEINRIPALEQYSKWTGKKIEDLMGGNLLVQTILSPLGVKDRLGDLVAIRHPMAGNDDLSMNIGNHLAEKTAIVRMEATVDELIQSTTNTMKEVKEDLPNGVGAYLLVHCGGRKLGIGDRIDEVAKRLKDEAGDTPFMTIFTFGEYGSNNNDRNTCGGLMLSFTGLGK